MARAATPWDGPWTLLLLCCAGSSLAAAPKQATTPAQTLERYRRLVPYMTYYVAQGLTQRPVGPGLGPPSLNALESYAPPGRLRAVQPGYATRPGQRPSGGVVLAASAPGATAPPRTLFRFDFARGPAGRLKDQPFLPSPPLKPENEDSDDYFKPVTDTANYYRPAGPDQDQHLVVFPEDDARHRAKVRQHQRKPQQQLLLQSQQQQLDEAYRLKLLLLQQQQLQQAKELRAQLQAQRIREQLRAQLQQDHEIRALVQAQQAKRLREQQLQAQQHARQREQHLRLQQEQELQAQLKEQGLREQQHLQALLQAQQQEAHAHMRANELKKLRAQQVRQELQIQAQLQAQLQAQQERVKQQQLLQEEEQQQQRDHDAPADTEVEQQVVVSLEEVGKAPSSAPTDTAEPSASAPASMQPVVYAEEVGGTPKIENVATPGSSSSREVVAHLINGLQLSNKLPQSLTPDNFDMSLKTILQLLKVLHKSKATNGPVTTPARIKVSPEAPERETAFYIGGGTVSQTFPAPSKEGSTPGKPGIDYPAYDSIPQTTFSCATQRYKGFFGDPETNCQVWHYCDLNGGQASFLCPNGTIFSQVGLTCDWWFNVRCASTAQLYVLNERLYKYILPVKPSFPEDFSGPDVDRYLTEKFREMQAKARGRKEKLKQNEKEDSSTTGSSGQSQEPVETNQTEEQEASTNKTIKVPHHEQVEEQQQLDPDL